MEVIIIPLVSFVIGGLLAWFVMRVLLKSKYDNIIREAEKESEVIKQKKLLEIKKKMRIQEKDCQKVYKLVEEFYEW